MVFIKKIRFIVYFIFLISFFSNIFAASYPGFSFAGGNYPSGLVNISGLSSSGTIVEMSINSNFISSKNVLSAVKIANLSFGILDTSIPVGATLRFSNNLPSTIFVLNISGFGFNTLNPNDIYDFSSYNIGDFSYRDENTLVRKTISVIDKMEKFNFENVPQNYLNDGSNSVGFVIKSLKDNSVLKTLNFSFNYDKYPVKISLNNFTSIINQKKIQIQGVTTDSTSVLNYVLNFDGVISNLGMLNPIAVRPDGSFNLSLNNLNEGNNTIRFISLDKNNNEIFNGQKKFNVLVDTQIPSIKILSAFYTATNVLGNNGNTKRNADFSLSEMFINGNNLILNISTDAVVINYTLNSRNMSCGNVINSTVSCNLNLVNGQNNLTLYAIDIAGNIFKQAHTIMLDTSSISLKTNTLEPKQGSTVHFFLQDLKGNVNKGAVKITAFTIGQDSKYFYTDPSGAQQTGIASCNDFKFMGLTRDVGYVDYSVVGGQINPTDKQISLLDLVSKKVSGVSDGNGYFVLKNLVLKDKSYDPNAQNTNSVSKVSSVNTICFIMADKFGNVNTASSFLTLDAGNTQWSPGEISLTPNTVYAAEIEQLQKSRSNGGNIRFGLIGHLHYSGSGNLKYVRAPQFRSDSRLNKDSQYIRVIQNEMHFKIDKRTNDMIFYFPVEVLPMHKKPLDYPKSLNLGFAVTMSYSVVGKDIPIDTVNPVYFQTQLNIETPLDTAKWLSPAMLDKGIGFLNKSIKFTKTAKKYMGVAAIGGVVACTAAKFYYGAQIALEKNKGGNDMQKNINNYKRDLYYICDRVICSATPLKCDKSKSSNFFDLTKNGLNPTAQQLSDKRSQTQITSKNNGKKSKLSEFNSLDCRGYKTCISGGKPGITCGSSQTIYTQKNSYSGTYKQTEKIKIPNACGEAKFGKISWTGGPKKANQNDLQNYLKSHNNQFPPGFIAKPTGVNLKGMSNSCYSKGPDRFDETRAFGQDGINPEDDLIDSIQSVCFTDTYSHLNKYLLIQESIKKCLQGAKIGIAKGAYCERLMSQAVCDVATYAIFKTASEKAKRSSPETHTKSGFLEIVNGANTGDALLKDRYSNSKFFSAVGLNSNNVVKNVCMAAITGDWSILTDNILGAIDKNQIKPSFGPPYPISRMQSYDPLTGDLSIMYKFTYAAISGGQNINTKVEFLCDPNGDNNDYCPENTILSSSDPNSGSSLGTSNLYVNKGDFKQENIVLFDKTARYRYNVLKLTHTFDKNGKKTTLVQRVPISPRGEGMLFNCHWDSGVGGSNLNSGSNYGIYCDPLFGKSSSISAYRFGKNSHLSPEKSNVYYASNNVYLNFNYDVRSNLPNQQNSFDLAYRADCNGGKGRTIIVGSKSIDTKGSNLGNNITDLFSIPEHLALNSNSKSNLFQLDLKKNSGLAGKLGSAQYVGIKAINVNGFKGQSFSISGLSGLNLLNSASTFLIGQNLVVNKGSKGESERVILGYEGTSDKLEFKTDRIIAGTNFYLIYGTLDSTGKIKTEIGSIPFSESGTLSSNQHGSFENLQEGSCKLDVKILPPGNGDLVTYDTFDNISAIGNSKDVISNINSNNNLNTLHLNFVVKDTPVGSNLKLNPNFFELTKPISNGYICVAPKSKLDLAYIFQGPNGVLKNKNLKLSGNLIAVRDTSKFTNKAKSIDSNGPGTFSFVVPENFEMNKNFEMKLNYVLSYTKGVGKNLLDKNIGFNLRVSDKCSLGGENGGLGPVTKKKTKAVAPVN